MFMRHLHFFFWELSKWILKPPKHQTVITESNTGSQQHGPVATEPQPMFLKLSVERASLIPSHLPCFDYFLSSHLPSQPMSPSSIGLLPSILLHLAAGMVKPEILARKGQYDQS